MRLFKNAILDSIRPETESSEGIIGDAKLIYENTTINDPLRRLLVDLSMQGTFICWRERSFEQLTVPFLLDFIFALQDRNMVPSVPVDCSAYRADVRSHFCERYHNHTEVQDRHLTPPS